MARETDRPDNTTDPASVGPVPEGERLRPATAARESLSWIRALASQWEDDLPGRGSPDDRR